VCGIVATRPACPESILRLGLEALQHRGPDGSNSFVNDEVALGLTRLAIVGSESHDQPTSGCFNDLHSVFNGEIYNYLELRNLLIQKGHKIASESSDASIICHLFEEFGIEFVKQLRGMFAIVLWDSNEKILYLIRDSVGIKPIYFATIDGYIYVASEIEAISKMAPKKLTISNLGLKNVSNNQMTFAPDTIWEGIFSLPPGTILEYVNDTSVRISRWNSVHFPTRRKSSDLQLEQDVLDELLRDSIGRQFEHGQKPAILLSGGLDSSLVANYVAEIDHSIESFHLDFNSDSRSKTDDRLNAQKLASQLGFNHIEISLDGETFFSQLNECLDSFNQPFLGVTSMYFVSKVISTKYKSCLTGDGADELFCSYRRVSHYARLHYNNLSQSENEKWSGLSSMGDMLNQDLDLGTFRNEIQQSLAEFTQHDFVENLITDDFDGAIMYDQIRLLPEQVLLYSDHLSMAHGLEIRPPFLDERVIEFARSLPKEMLINSKGENKLILKRLAERYFEKDFIYRKKEGFSIPLESWLMMDCGREWLWQNFKEFGADVFKYLDKSKVTDLVENYIKGEHKDFFLAYRVVVTGRFLNRVGAK